MILKLRLAILSLALSCYGLLWGQSPALENSQIGSSVRTQLATLAKHEKEKDWEAYIHASTQLMSSYQLSEDYPAGIQLGKKALQKIKRKARQFLPSTWRIYTALGRIYELVGDKEQALDSYQKQLQLTASLPGEKKHWQLATTYNQLGAFYLSQKQLDTALIYLQKAEQSLPITQEPAKLHPPSASALEVMVETYSQLSKVYENQESIQQALSYAKLALSTAKLDHIENAYPLSPHYNRIGTIYFALEEYEKSIEYHRKAIYILKSYAASHKNEHLVASELALSYAYLADVLDKEEGIAYYKKSLQLIQNDEDHLLLRMKNLSKIAENYNWLDNFTRAWPYIQEADSLWLKYEPVYHKDPAFQFARAGIYHSTGHYWKRLGSFDKSLHFYKKYVEVWEKYGSGPVNSENIGMLMEIAEIYNWRMKEDIRYADSSVYYTQKALIIATKTFNSYDLTQLPAVEDLKDITYMYAILKQLARCVEIRATLYGDEGEKKKALRTALAIMDLADQFHSRSLQQMNTLRAGQAAALIHRSLMIYHGSTVFCTYLNRLEPSADLIEKCFYYSQRMKAQKLWLVQLKEEANAMEGLPAAIQIHEKELLSDIQHYEKLVLKAQYEEDPSGVEHYRNNQLFQAQRAYETFQVQLEREYPKYFNHRFNFKPNSIAELQQTLKPDELLIEYLLSGYEQLAIVVQKGQAPQLITLSTLRKTCSQAFSNIEQLHDLLQRSPMLRKTSRAKFVSLSHALYRHFLQPIEASLIGKKRLIIIGHDRINYVPFETLLRSAEMAPFRDLDFLIRGYEISYHYSSNLLVQSRKKSKRAEGGIYVFAPVYDEHEDLALSTKAGSIVAKDGALRAFDEKGQYTPLPASEFEANNILHLFDQQKAKGNQLALRRAATEANLKMNLEDSYRYIHIAGHSFANLKKPEFSGIACFTSTSDLKEDGILYMGEIYALSPQADLVTLSSCESGSGKLEKADGLIGLNRAFVYAGIPNVVFSLWKVYDRVSATFMVKFYQEVLSGDSYAASLRKAKLELLDNEATASPHYWSPYLLIGR